MIPIESGRGCPYGCDFCTVTGFFGDTIRFRSNESVVSELLSLKRRARTEHGQMGVFFIDDNFAINVKRTNSLLREIIAQDAAMRSLRSASIFERRETAPDLIACGGRWIFVGLESMTPQVSWRTKASTNRRSTALALDRLRNAVSTRLSHSYSAWTATSGVAKARNKDGHLAARTSVYGLMTPYPAPALRPPRAGGRLTRPKHWPDFRPFQTAYTLTDLDRAGGSGSPRGLEPRL
jgi:hypothetical protein